jgi:peptide-methionine (R)-S-oxide reductase
MMNDRRTFLGIAGLATAGVLLFGRTSGAGATMAFAVNHTSQEWLRILGPQRYHILREAGTERPFTSPLNDEHHKGTFVCAACDLPLFSSAAKFDSGTGWPSFWRALPKAVVEKTDRSLLMERTEILCARCGGHLGHVFNDGPKPTGLRYCMNGLALKFRAA